MTRLPKAIQEDTVNEEQGAKWLERIGFERLNTCLWKNSLLRISIRFEYGDEWVIYDEEGEVAWGPSLDTLLREYLSPLHTVIRNVYNDAILRGRVACPHCFEVACECDNA